MTCSAFLSFMSKEQNLFNGKIVVEKSHDFCNFSLDHGGKGPGQLRVTEEMNENK